MRTCLPLHLQLWTVTRKKLKVLLHLVLEELDFLGKLNATFFLFESGRCRGSRVASHETLVLLFEFLVGVELD